MVCFLARPLPPTILLDGSSLSANISGELNTTAVTMLGMNLIANVAATRRGLVTLAVMAALFVGGTAQAQDKSILVASTTSTQDTGLFGRILPLFKQKTGIEVRVIAEGTGQALDTGAGATPMWCSCTPSHSRRNSSPRATVCALRCHVQRFHSGRAEDRSRGDQRHEGHCRSVQKIRAKSTPLLPAAISPAPTSRNLISGSRRHRHREGSGHVVQARRPRHGRDTQHRVRVECLCTCRPWHLVVVQEPR